MTGRRGGGVEAQAFLRALMISEGGSISFERFMQEALYHPQFGYYTRNVRTIGREGDFSTSATLHGALGQAVAAWAVQHRCELPGRGIWHLIELGGGNGQLAEEILCSLGWWERHRVRYHLVERSETLREKQRAQLARWGMIYWHEEIETALQVSGGQALILSNEFVDAFPCLRLEWDGAAAAWREVRVSWQEETQSFSERLTPWATENGGCVDCEHAWQDGAPLPMPGQRIEKHRSYFRWLQKWVPHWHHGAMLTVDYGDVWPHLYHRRAAGTLRGYFHHQQCVGAEIYARVGWQDLTSDVNFSDLQTWGTALGLKNVPLVNQAEFIRRWLPGRTRRRYAHDPSFAFLTDDEGAGGAFKTLEQRR